MEITTNFDPHPIEKHLDRIEREMEELRAEIPLEFADWQNSDMNRKRAQTKTIETEKPTSNFIRSSTFILPTSRFRVKLRRRLIRRLKKTGQHERIRVSTRPVLRERLLVDFKERFRSLLDRAF
jgi:hypothetical protein